MPTLQVRWVYNINHFCVRDDVQDTLQKCMEQANKIYHVVPDLWQKTNDNPPTWETPSLPHKTFNFALLQDQQKRFRLAVKDGTQQVFCGAPKTLDEAKNFAYKNFLIQPDAWHQEP